MFSIVIAVVVYESLVVLAYLLCWRLVRGVDTRLPILSTVGGDAGTRTGYPAPGRAALRAPSLAWQLLTFLLGATVLASVALLATAALASLRGALIAAEVASPVSMDPILLRLALPVGHLVVLLVLYQRLRGSVPGTDRCCNCCGDAAARPSGVPGPCQCQRKARAAGSWCRRRCGRIA